MSQVIREIAEKEVKEETFRELIEKEKQKIRDEIAAKRWWHKFIPFKVMIKIERR